MTPGGYMKAYLKWLLWNLKLDYTRIRYRAKLGYILLVGNNPPPVYIMNTIVRDADYIGGTCLGVWEVYAKRKTNLTRYLDYKYPRWRKTTLHIGFRLLPEGMKYQDKELRELCNI